MLANYNKKLYIRQNIFQKIPNTRTLTSIIMKNGAFLLLDVK